MTQITAPMEWLETVPNHVKQFVLSLEDLADTALQQHLPYHTIRIVEEHFDEAGNNAGRLPAWCIFITAQLGWEYESTTCDRQGTMWIMFKNPYIFS